MRFRSQSLKALFAVPLLLATLACGGGGGGSSATPSQTIAYGHNYTAPSPSGSAPMILLNTALSTSTVAVFDVMGVDPNLSVKGVNLSLAVDTTKMAFVAIPGDSGASSKLGAVSTGGFGGGKAFSVAKLRNGAYEMASAIQGVGSAPVPSNQVLLRFALSIQGQPVEGIVTTIVGTSSGLLDANARLIPGTAPVVGRLEIRKS